MEPSVSTGMSFPLIPTHFILQEGPSWFREQRGSERLRNCGVAAVSLRKGLEQQESLVLLENRDREAAGGHPGNTRPLEWSSRCPVWVVQGSGTSSAPGKCKIQGFLSQRSGPSQQIQRRSSSCAPRLSPALQQRFPGEKQNFGIHTHSSKKTLEISRENAIDIRAAGCYFILVLLGGDPGLLFTCERNEKRFLRQLCE